MHRFLLLFGLALPLGVLTGCGEGQTRQTIQIPAADPLAEAKAILNNYVRGMPVTSEATSFPILINRVKEKDPARGDLLEKGFQEILKSRKNPGPKARELLKKLG